MLGTCIEFTLCSYFTILLMYFSTKYLVGYKPWKRTLVLLERVLLLLSFLCATVIFLLLRNGNVE